MDRKCIARSIAPRTARARDSPEDPKRGPEAPVTNTYSLDAAAAQPTAAPPPQAGPPPVIVASRRRLDNRFPVLGFTIRTFGRPYFEVLLATDSSLFDPANASKRTTANFYASRQDGGLGHAVAEDTAYIVP